MLHFVTGAPPASGLGANGDTALRTDTGEMFEKVAGSWTLEVSVVTDQALPPIASVRDSDPIVATDAVSSWWTEKAAWYFPASDTVITSGASRGGPVWSLKFDLKAHAASKLLVSRERRQADDHYTCAFLFAPSAADPTASVPETRRGVIVRSWHGRDRFLRVREFDSYGDMDMLANPELLIPFQSDASYGQVLHKPDQWDDDPGGAAAIFLCRSQSYLPDGTFTPGAKQGYWAARVRDLYVSQSGANSAARSPNRPATVYDTFPLWEASYMSHVQRGNVVQYAVTDHPTTSSPTVLRYIKSATTTTGVFRNGAGGALPGSPGLWTTAPAAGDWHVDKAGMDTVLVSTNSGTTGVLDAHRLFYPSDDGSRIAVLRFNRATREQGGTYGVMLRTGTGPTAADWAWEPICPSGTPFGAETAPYVGGMMFRGTESGPGDNVYLIREDGGEWRLERWDRTGPATWTRAAVLFTAPNGMKLGRPRWPHLMHQRPGDPFVLFQIYERYQLGGFLDWYGHTCAIEDTVPV